MKNLKLERVEIKDNLRLLDGEKHIASYFFIDNKLESDSEKIKIVLHYFDTYFLSFPIWDMLNEKADEDLDFEESFVERQLLDMFFERNKSSNIEFKKEIEKCILKLYENGTIVQINNVVLYLDDGYECKDYDSSFISCREKYDILSKIYILDMYLSYDIKDLDLYVFDYEQLLEIHKGLKNDVDVRIYANPKYHWEDMSEIREELEDWGIDISKYVGVGFSDNELYEIKRGLESGVDVSVYADTDLNDDEMYELRRKLEEGKKVYKLRYDKSQLDIIINALEEAKAYYEQYLFDSYENFDELGEIINNLREL